MTVAERFATFRFYCLMHVYARVGLTLTLEEPQMTFTFLEYRGSHGKKKRGVFIRPIVPAMRSHIGDPDTITSI